MKEQQLGLFSEPVQETEIRFKKFGSHAMEPVRTENDTYFLLSASDLLLESDMHSAYVVNTEIGIFVDDDSVEVHLRPVANHAWKPSRDINLVVTRTHNNGVRIGTYAQSRFPYIKREVVCPGFGADPEDYPKYETEMDDKVFLIDGTEFKYPKRVAKNSGLVKRGDPLFEVIVYRKVKAKLVQE